MPASPLVLRAEFIGDTVTLFISGEVDMSNVDTLDTTLQHLLDADPAVLCVDMSQVTFCGSAAFQTLFSAAQNAADRSSRLVTKGLRAPAMRVVGILGLRAPLGVPPGRLAPQQRPSTDS